MTAETRPLAFAGTIVTVPGLRGRSEDHWQAHLAGELPGLRAVEPIGRDRYDLEERIGLLDEAIVDCSGPVIIVAHSAGVLTTVHWAVRHDRPVRGALLATPPDLTSPLSSEYPSLESLREAGWLPIPLTPLRFPSIVVASANDPLGNAAAVSRMAAAWGSRLVDAGPVGHLNPASGYGHWPMAAELISELR